MANKVKESVFKEIHSEGKTPLFVYSQIVEHPETMKLLSDDGLRPLTYQEALARAPELIKKLKGWWFRLDGQGIHEDGTYTYDANGELAEPTGKETVNQKVLVFPGVLPLSLNIFADYTSEVARARFGLYGDTRYHSDQMVVGVMTPLREAEWSMEKGRAAIERLRRGL